MTRADATPAATPPRKAPVKHPIALLASVGVLATGLVAGCGGEDTQAASTAAPAPVSFSFDESGCSVAELSTDASGFVDFRVTSNAKKKGEYEIISSEPSLKHESYMDPGEVDESKVLLDPGTYTVICFNSNAKKRATLVVGGGGTPTTATTGTTTSAAAGLAPIAARYTRFVRGQASALQSETRKFTNAVRAGDLQAAKDLYARVRMPWESIEPIAEAFPDADAAIDSRADDHAKGEADPAFTGFHALEYGLWAQGTKKGANVDLDALANRLDADVAELVDEVKKLDVSPSQMVGGAAALIDEAAQTKVTGEEERYSKTDLWTLSANLDGAARIVALLAPALQKADPSQLAATRKAIAAVRTVLDRYGEADGSFASYSTVSAADKAKLKTTMADLAEQLSSLAGVLGLEVRG